MNTIKKLLLIAILSAAFVLPSKAITSATGVFTNGVFTNFPNLAPTLFPLRVTQVLIANQTTNAQTLWLYDINTNILTNVVAAYTNTVSYLTNYSFIVTNYYGNITTNTNYVLFDNTNNAVAAVTNTILPKVIITCPASSSFVSPAGVSYWFYSGLWITNTGSAQGTPIAVTLTYQ